MAVFAAKKTESADWLQRMALGSEFELSMAGFGLMGEPGSIAERLLMAEAVTLRDADVRTAGSLQHASSPMCSQP